MHVYADNAATTRMHQTAIDTMTYHLNHTFGNPSSLYTIGQEAKEVLETARADMAACFGAQPREIYFTSGGSEADNQAITSAAYIGARKGKKHIISTTFEHHAVLHTLKRLEKQGFEVTLLDVHTQCGCARPEFSRKPVKPGGKGTVEVTFDPKDRYGDFSIGLTVIAGNGNYRKFNTLVVKGYVISRIPEAEIRYPYALSAALRADNRAIGMRQLSRSDPKRTRQLRLLNTSAKTLRLAYRTDSGHLALSGPGEIAPGKEAVLEFTLDPRNMPDGQFVLKCTVSTQDEEIPVEVKGQIVGR